MDANTGGGKFAGVYDIAFNPALKRVHQTILQLVKKYECKSIIDLGSGTGAQSRVLANHGFIVTGIDASYEMITVSRKKSQNKVKFIHKDITSIKFSDNSFDAANISLVLHPNSPDVIHQIIFKARELIKKDGVVFITDYGKGFGLSGRMANAIMQIIESFAKEDHCRNYFSFMKHNGIDQLMSMPFLQIIERKKYYGGALQTFVISFSSF